MTSSADRRGHGGLVLRAWLACMERSEEAAFRQLMDHVGGCVPCTAAVDRGELLDVDQLCDLGARLLATWDATEDAIAATLLPEAVPA